jgi:thymidine phosphorylase
MHHHATHRLKVKALGIDTYRENIIYMRADCPVCVSEGYTSLTRLVIHKGQRQIVATLNVVHSNLLSPREAGLSQYAMNSLQVKDGDSIVITHLQPIESLAMVRAKMYGRELTETEFDAIISDVVNGSYSNIELAAFIAACSNDHLTINEIIGLTKAMIRSGKTIKWGYKQILDKHCVGGLPGNRTTPIVVSIIAAAGLAIPKTSSRSITSPAGTADTMETMAPVNLDLKAIKQVVKKELGCVVWGNAMKLSPADDILIAIEKALDVDSAGQMIASVLSKKASAGSTHVLIDIPVGPTAKVRSHEDALKLEYYFKAVAETIPLKVKVVLTDGTQPVGRGIGPSLEARDVLAVLRNDTNAPIDLRERALFLAGNLLEMSEKFDKGKGIALAKDLLNSGKAYQKFMSICKAQGGFTEPGVAKYTFDVLAEKSGILTQIDNRKLARIAKLAGAPASPESGIWLNKKLGDPLKEKELIFTIHSNSQGEMLYAQNYLQSNPNLFEIS